MNKKEIIKQIKSHYKKNPKMTRKSFEEDKDVCSIWIISKYFGSWKEALIAAGIKKYVEYDKEKILEILKEKKKLGELEYRKDIRQIKEIPSNKYLEKFWSWEELAEILGIKRKVYVYKNEELIEKYLSIKFKYKKVTSLIMLEETGIHPETIRNHFGSWNKFLKLLKEENVHELTKVTHTNEELIKMYREFSIKTGNSEYGASVRELKKCGFPYSRSVLSSRFTNMSKLKELAGFRVKREVIPKYTKIELKSMLYNEYKKCGRKLTQAEIAENENLPHPTSVFNHFQTTKISEVWQEILRK